MREKCIGPRRRVRGTNTSNKQLRVCEAAGRAEVGTRSVPWCSWVPVKYYKNPSKNNVFILLTTDFFQSGNFRLRERRVFAYPLESPSVTYPAVVRGRRLTDLGIKTRRRPSHRSQPTSLRWGQFRQLARIQSTVSGTFHNHSYQLLIDRVIRGLIYIGGAFGISSVSVHLMSTA